MTRNSDHDDDLVDDSVEQECEGLEWEGEAIINTIATIGVNGEFTVELRTCFDGGVYQVTMTSIIVRKDNQSTWRPRWPLRR